MSVVAIARWLWFCITKLCDWLTEFPPISKWVTNLSTMQWETKTNCDLFPKVFRRLHVFFFFKINYSTSFQGPFPCKPCKWPNAGANDLISTIYMKVDRLISKRELDYEGQSLRDTLFPCKTHVAIMREGGVQSPEITYVALLEAPWSPCCRQLCRVNRVGRSKTLGTRKKSSIVDMQPCFFKMPLKL